MIQCANRLLKKFFQCLALLALCLHVVWAADNFTIADIQVEGLQRVEPGTVFATLPFRVGDLYSDEKGTAAIRSLFGLGVFQDVRIEIKNQVVVVAVEERPVIAAVEFLGTKEFDKDVLRKALRDIGLVEGRPFDRAVADRAEQELKRQYINRSYYGAEVVTTVTPIERNRVNLSFSVVEGDVAKIKEIRIVGNQAFSESSLISQFDLNTGNWLSWYTKSDRYSRNKLNADLETLRSYYLSRGYLEFSIDSTQVTISQDRQNIGITINVNEGQRFGVSEVELDGYYLGRDEEFKSLIAIKPGQPYNANDVTVTIKSFTDYFANFGFAFARVEQKTVIDRANNLVKVVLQADPSRRAYVRRIVVTGNERTRDEIVRREMRQFESAWYDGNKIKLSKERLDRLGYFKEVDIETSEVPNAPDQVDLLVHVSERPTGSLQIGAGYSSFEKLFVTFGITQDNIFGSGQSLGLQFSTSKYNQVVVVNNTDPYFTDDGIARTLELSHRSQKPYIEQAGNYRLITDSLGLRFGIPMSEVDRFLVGIAVEQNTIVEGTSMPANYLKQIHDFGDTYHNIPVTLGWVRDTRDSYLTPTRGALARAYSEIGVLGDAKYLRNGAQYQQFIPINKQFSFALNTDITVGQSIGDNPYPVFKNLYAGGLGSVRGFDQGSLGPRDITGLIQGGTRRLVLNAEVFAPFPGAGNDKTLRLYGFVDAGNIWGQFEKVDLSTLRSAYGLGISWVSPMGPLRLAIANPITRFPGDRITRLQFQIGNSF
jgi:outer membrane protein insertion porin family